MLKFKFNPMALRLPIASVFETFEKFLGLHSKQPLTVNVSKPNSFLKIKNKDSLCIDISYLDFLASLRPESIEYS